MGQRGLAFVLSVFGSLASAGEVRLAVTSDFRTAAEALARDFEYATGHTVTVEHGATGTLVSRIEAGGAADILFAAGDSRPADLVRRGLARESVAYATGRLVLVARVPVGVETAPDDVAGLRLALADPIACPYGRASTRAMERLGLDTSAFSPVVAADLDQVAALFAAGEADVAFVAAAQAARLDAAHVLPLDGIVPPLRQEAALLTGTEAAEAFWDWLSTGTAQAAIEAAGYAPG